MNYDFKTDWDSNNNCNSNAKNSSEIDLDNLTFEFISEINDKLYEDLSNIANICNKFDNVKNTFFIDNEDCKTTIDNELNENIKDIVTDYFDLNRDYSSIKKSLAKIDIYMKESIEYGSGIRILNQDLWETIISFIISDFIISLFSVLIDVAL